MSDPQRILVVGPAWVGDMVMAQSLFKALRQRHPQCVIDVLAPAWTEPLLACMPEVREAIPMPLGHGQLEIGVRRRMGRGLRAKKYTQAIVLPRSLKSALVPFFAKIPRRTGYVGEMRWGLLNDARKLDKQRLTMTVQRFVALGLPPGNSQPPAVPKPRLEIDAEAARQVLKTFRLSTRRPALALCPGAEYGPAKQWPAAYFAEVARHKRNRGWQVWVLGSGKDAGVAGEIAGQVGEDCTNLAGETSLEQAIALLSQATAVVSNDSGLMHVAAAFDRPLVAVYGSSDPRFTPPLSDNSRIETLGLECSPCFKRECPLGHTRCLTELTPEWVIRALGSFDA